MKQKQYNDIFLYYRKILPVHFLTGAELGREEEILRDWLDVLVTESGLVVAQQNIARPPLMVAQMTEEWLNYYRKIAQSNTVPGTVTVIARTEFSYFQYEIHLRTQQRQFPMWQ